MADAPGELVRRAAGQVDGEGTVKTHVARVVSKLDLRDRTETVVETYEHKIVAGRRVRSRSPAGISDLITAAYR